VLIAQIASAPPSAAARAISPIFGTLGVSLGTTGISTAAFTAVTISFTRAASCPISMPYPLACGHDRFSSRPSEKGASCRATATISSTLPPKIDVSKKRSSGMSSAASCLAASSAPGLVRPTAFMKHPGAYWVMIGSRLPRRGTGPMLLVVITPICGTCSNR